MVTHFLGIHHVKIVANNVTRLRDIFVGKFLFKESVKSLCGKSILVERGDARFLLEERNHSEQLSEGACDIVIECSSVDSLVDRVCQGGGTILQNPIDEQTDSGIIRKAVVQSAVPTVRHTIIEASRNKGFFLPNFISSRERETSTLPPALNRLRFDHVTIACDVGQGEAVLDWYEKCFGMKRFPVSSTEIEDEGFIVKHGTTGMRLKALNYWRCMETGVECPSENDLKVVVAEPLSHSGPNQISTFLEENDGPGVQHIALLTDDIISVATCMKSAGLQLMRPPDTYYEEVSDLQMRNQITDAVISDIDLKNLKESCILIDVETKVKKENEDIVSSLVQQNILYQCFTKPLFERDTFFMELIQRNGSTGFGAANIQALWKAVDLYMSSKENQQKLKLNS